MTTVKKPATRKPAAKKAPAPSVPDEKPEVTDAKPVEREPQAGQDLSALDAMIAQEAGSDADSESLAGDVAAQKERAAQDEADEAAARAGAAMAVGFAETMLGMKYPFVQIPKEQRFQIIEKATPVMRKYGGGLPDWLRPYQEEIELGMVVATAGVGVFMQVQQHKAAEQRRALEERRRQQAGQPAPQPAVKVDLSIDENANQEGAARRVDAA